MDGMGNGWSRWQDGTACWVEQVDGWNRETYRLGGGMVQGAGWSRWMDGTGKRME
jgi:hypothetical protein